MTTTKVLGRVRSRRRRRGAAMTEAAIIATFMVVQFACIWAAVSFQKAKIGVMDDVRVTAWLVALNGCGGGGDMMSGLNQAVGDSGAGSVPDISSASDLGGGDFGSSNSVFKDTGYGPWTKERQVKFPNVIGGSSYTMLGKMSIRCNEPKKNDDGKKYFFIALGAGLIVGILASIF